MPGKKLPALLLEDRRIIFRNFSGAEGRFNAKGQRNFHVVLDEAEAEAMMVAGWNVKYAKPRDDGDTPPPHLPVKVRFDNFPPNVVLITSRGKTRLTEDMIDILDWAEIEQVDMILNPSWYEVNGKSGYSAYLKSLYVTIHEDELELKYADVPDSAQSSLPVVEEPEMIQAKSEILAIERGSVPF
jgi:hypothetical protein